MARTRRTDSVPSVTLVRSVWDAVGWTGQAVFTGRVAHQWWASERAGRSVVPRAYWGWSLVGTLLVLVYAVSRADAVFVVGSATQGALFARNLALVRPRPARPQPTPARVAALCLLLVGSIGVAAATVFADRKPATVWLAVGAAGQALWMGRFALQWWASERDGVSHLPAGFFRISIAGAILLCAYAVAQRDLVNVAAYALNPIPYARNLVLLKREARARTAAQPGA